MFTRWPVPATKSGSRGATRPPASCSQPAAQRSVALEAIQALGGNGYINEFPAGRLLRDAKLYEIGAGTQEIRRILIGRELFDAASREPRAWRRIRTDPHGARVSQGGRGAHGAHSGSHPAAMAIACPRKPSLRGSSA